MSFPTLPPTYPAPEQRMVSSHYAHETLDRKTLFYHRVTFNHSVLVWIGPYVHERPCTLSPIANSLWPALLITATSSRVIHISSQGTPQMRK